jgi:uncharacterized small protein (DUF1192 family)
MSDDTKNDELRKKLTGFLALIVCLRNGAEVRYRMALLHDDVMRTKAELDTFERVIVNFEDIVGHTLDTK